jgi:hypothetical protein
LLSWRLLPFLSVCKAEQRLTSGQRHGAPLTPIEMEAKG